MPLARFFLALLLSYRALGQSVADEVTYVDDAAFHRAILNSTNFFRFQHNAEPVTWNDSLANYAEQHVRDCVFHHSDGPHGENIAHSYVNVSAAIDAFGNERDRYDFGNQGFGEQTGHFTQLVWQATRTVGCSRKWCDDSFSGWYLVCEYDPRGNVLGLFDGNVSRQVTDESPGTAQDDGEDVADSGQDRYCPLGADCSLGIPLRSHSFTMGSLGNVALLAAIIVVNI